MSLDYTPMKDQVIIDDPQAGSRMLGVAICMAIQAVVWYALGALSWPIVQAWLEGLTWN